MSRRFRWGIAQERLSSAKKLAFVRAVPVTFAELRAGGIDFPAAVVSELELSGYEIERVHDRGRPIGVRLLKTERCDTAVAQRRHRWPRRTAGKRRTT
jgi:hypothetical protein